MRSRSPGLPCPASGRPHTGRGLAFRISSFWRAGCGALGQPPAQSETCRPAFSPAQHLARERTEAGFGVQLEEQPRPPGPANQTAPHQSPGTGSGLDTGPARGSAAVCHEASADPTLQLTEVPIKQSSAKARAGVWPLDQLLCEDPPPRPRGESAVTPCDRGRMVADPMLEPSPRPPTL
ncbi:hypothetical protein AAFF_G00407580 [Aldrovandia affinis]|uniref:Uncharacterized protein n=1 Tax=Aldrovandia affinis TaxID=143900 RepID=A0AAD7SC96_9TELE|nr:hypothetical protein AAFF_G00407580 [Aldrovandia affinis]